MIRERDLLAVEDLIVRAERGEPFFADPPLCTVLVREVRRLRHLLKDAYPFVVGTPLQEEIRVEFEPDQPWCPRTRRGVGSRERTRTCTPSPGRA